MAIVKRVNNGWIVVSANTGIPIIDRVFNSRIAARNYAARSSPRNY